MLLFRHYVAPKVSPHPIIAVYHGAAVYFPFVSIDLLNSVDNMDDYCLFISLTSINTVETWRKC